MLETLDNSVRGVKALGLLVNVPVLAAIPYLETDRESGRRRLRMWITIASIIAVLATAALLVHFLWMPLDVLWYRAAAPPGELRARHYARSAVVILDREDVMERIRDAVQRARLEGTASAAGFVALGPRTLTAQVRDAQDHAREIAYTTTRTLNVPAGDLREKRIVSAFEPCIFTDAYKILSTQVSHRLREHHWNTLAITSPGEREGKTLTAVNLAISLAKEFNQTALLVDADLRHPGVRDCLGLPPGPGLSDYLLSDASIEQLLINPGIRGFVVLPGGTPQPNSSEILGWRKMTQLVHELKQRYPSRIVLFDLPPLLSSADVLAFAPHVEATLLVVEEGRTSREDVARAAELLGPTHLLGTVLNKTEELGTSVKEPQRRLDGLRKRRSH